MQTAKDAYRRSRWFMPALVGALGLIQCAAQWIGGGLVSLGILLGFAALRLLACRCAPGMPAACATLHSPAEARRFVARELGDDPVAWKGAMELAGSAARTG